LKYSRTEEKTVEDNRTICRSELSAGYNEPIEITSLRTFRRKQQSGLYGLSASRWGFAKAPMRSLGRMSADRADGMRLRSTG
jgi:hypothetical protein